ncbi:TAXI family TRAP transporter solute-binding subunit [Acuticoccus sp. MNP-M23]|uniref:TAXI family TRAP transporter solute-binding subunit n=1 Tax=Acuticoccus sp. MNP-M23 TaxID=3072793 RepID=UPI002814FE36|nr:TAXI family TRAP transporter solute-binding subunit [Acuticoccus sp. MNP-M23]WMS42909.1 TAXI family TRAP transporter solute-binding subunit [Acuticoccus sp. MNP-M23]
MLYRTLGALALGLAVSAGPAQAQSEDYLLATASTGGTYYPVGVALATLVKVKLQPSDKIGMSAINSAGSGENVALLRDDEVQFGILQGLYGAYAATGTGPIESEGPQENLRSITMLWPNVEHFVVKSDFVDSGTVSDLEGMKGKTMSMGAQNSGTLGSNSTIVGNLGMNMEEDFDLAYMGYTPSVDALQNGGIDGMSIPAGPPVSAISAAFANMGDDIAILSFTEEQRKAANGDFDDLWTAYTIPAGLYPGVDKDVVTIAQPNFLAVNASVPEETVYKITKTIFENLPFLQAIHPATKAMSPETATAGLPLKLHPGALRYFEEAGVPVADRLK